ncbi:MAG: hypothetical protein ACKOTE_12155 [Opitutaceae bacterium]
MPNTLTPSPVPRELFTRERRRTRMQNFFLRFEGTREQRPMTAALFTSAKPASVASSTRTVATLSR